MYQRVRNANFWGSFEYVQNAWSLSWGMKVFVFWGGKCIKKPCLKFFLPPSNPWKEKVSTFISNVFLRKQKFLWRCNLQLQLIVLKLSIKWNIPSKSRNLCKSFLFMSIIQIPSQYYKMLLTKDGADSDPIVPHDATYLTELANSHYEITYFRR